MPNPENLVSTANFEFLKDDYPHLYGLAQLAEQSLYIDPANASGKMRAFCEKITEKLCQMEGLDTDAAKSHFDRLKLLQKAAILPYRLGTWFHQVRQSGNSAVHEGIATESDALFVLELSCNIALWFLHYSTGKMAKQQFTAPQKHRVVQEDAYRSLQQRLQSLEEEFMALEEKKQEQYQQLPSQEKEERRQKASTLTLHSLNLSEEATRRLIDRQLAEAGWNVENKNQVIQEYQFPDYQGGRAQDSAGGYGKNRRADYALQGKDGKTWAVVEAKRLSKSAKDGKEQAKNYALSIQQHENLPHPPFCFYTNAFDIEFWDLFRNTPRKVAGFPSQDDLEKMRFQQEERKTLTQVPINQTIAGRSYQQRAIRKVLETFDAHRRKALLVMATGTGKTRMAVALVETLMRANWVKRVLFLVDRIGLREQTVEAFREHLPEAPHWPKADQTDFDSHARVYVATYPQMLNLIEGDKESISPFFFDLVIVDESHRSIYNVYQSILEYFDALQLGLTATPTDVIDHNTFALFDCQIDLHTNAHVPTDAYTYEEAVGDGFLSDFDSWRSVTKFRLEGMNEDTISVEDQKRLLADGKSVTEFDFEGTDLEKKVINRDTNRQIIQYFMEHSLKDPNGVTPGKTIFFCVSKQHAERMQELFDELYPQYNGELARVLVSGNKEVYGKNGLLNQFKTKDFPRIAISVDMLDTGIDVPEIVNLVFAKPVYSYTKFWQMIGRGTRLLNTESMKPWCLQKERFLIIDCWENFEYFKVQPQGRPIQISTSLPERFFATLIDWLEQGLENLDVPLTDEAQKRMLFLISQLPQRSIALKPHAAILHKAQSKEFWEMLHSRDLPWLREQLQPLMRYCNLLDFKAISFELTAIKAHIAQYQAEPREVAKAQQTILDTLNELPIRIKEVSEQIDLIKEVKQAPFWENVSLEKVQQLRQKIAPLTRYISNRVSGNEPKKTDFKDHVAIEELIQFDRSHGSMAVQTYREKAKERIRALVDTNITLQKLMRGEQMTAEELKSLQARLAEEDPEIKVKHLRQAYKHPKASFADLLKHLLGQGLLKDYPTQVGEAFAQYRQQHPTYSSKQLEFLELLEKLVISRQGKIKKKTLMEDTFKKLHPQGFLGLFPQEQGREELWKFVEGVVA